MKTLCRTLLVATLFMPGALWSGGTDRFKVDVEILAKTPGAGPYAESAKALFEEWYPKINAILYGEEHPLPFAGIKIGFADTVVIPEGNRNTEVPAMAEGNTIWVSLPYVKDYYALSLPTRWPRGFQAMMIHELAHINQHYGAYRHPVSVSWLVEGIADYVRHKFFEKDIEPKLRLDSDGYLKGYSTEYAVEYDLEKTKARLDNKGYLKGYTVAAAFLFWLEEHKDRNIIVQLDLALDEGRYSDELFQQFCTAPLDTLWQEFMVQSRTQGHE